MHCRRKELTRPWIDDLIYRGWGVKSRGKVTNGPIAAEVVTAATVLGAWRVRVAEYLPILATAEENLSTSILKRTADRGQQTANIEQVHIVDVTGAILRRLSAVGCQLSADSC